MAQARWNGKFASNAAKEAAADGLFEAAEFLLDEANKTVPIEEGDLERSGLATVDRRGLRAVVSYDTPYAVRQHEELDYWHEPGRRAKWLELALDENRDEMMQHIAQKLRTALR